MIGLSNNKMLLLIIMLNNKQKHFYFLITHYAGLIISATSDPSQHLSCRLTLDKANLMLHQESSL